MSVWRCSTYRAHARWARSTRRGVRGASCLSLRDKQRTFRHIQRFHVFYSSKTFPNLPLCHFACVKLVNVAVKVQHRGGELTACRCSSSSRTTAQAESRGKEKEGKEDVRHSKRLKKKKGERVQAERVEGKVSLSAAGTQAAERGRGGGRERSPHHQMKNSSPAVFVTFSSFISPSSCTINSLLLSCRDDILCSSSSFLCLKDTHSLYVRVEERKETADAQAYLEEIERL